MSQLTLFREGASMKILYVEDNLEFRRCILKFLPELLPIDVELFPVVNGREALEMFAGLQPDLIITDYQMPELTGEELAEALRGSGVSIPIILFSGSPDDCINHRLFNEIIDKSTPLKEVAQRIERNFKKAA